MRKALLLFLFSLIFITGAVFAAQVPPPFPTAFFANGVISRGVLPDPPATLDNFKVVFYKKTATFNNYSDGYAFGLTDAGGNVAINLHDDQRQMPLNTEDNYCVGIVSKNVGGTNYGLNEVAVKLLARDINNGWADLNQLLIEAGKTLAIEPGGIPDPDGGSLKGTVVDQNGNPLADTTLTVTINGIDYTVTTDANGTFTINGIPPGTYPTITVSTPDLIGTVLNITIVAGQTTTITEPIVLSPRVVGPGGGINIIAPIGGETLTINAQYDIKWSAPASIGSVTIAFSADGGGNYTDIASVANTGTYTWTIPNQITAQAKIKISDATNLTVFAESNLFAIAGIIARGGPQIAFTVLLDGYYDLNTTQQNGTPLVLYVDVIKDDMVLDENNEANNKLGTVVAADLPFYLTQNNNTKAVDGIGDLVPDGNYYLVIKHLNHLPVVLRTPLKAPFNLTRAQVTSIDLSDTAVQYEYQPLGPTNPSAMIVRNGKKILRGGEYKTDGLITIDDWSDWKDAYGADSSRANWNPKTNGNGDGNITIDDWDIWKDNYGARSYVPTR